MALKREDVLGALKAIRLPDGGDPVSRGLIRAVSVEGGKVRFVIEGESPEHARAIAPLQGAAEAAVKALPGVEDVSVVLTAHNPAPSAPGAGGADGAGRAGGAPKAPPQGLKLGRHPAPQRGKTKPAGVDHVLVIGSGKGGVGKSTVSSNLAVALARAGRRVGLLDADIHGPSQPRMMGLSQRPASPDGQAIIPLRAHGVTVMSLGLMLEPEQAVIWRGPMLMGALQQMLGQVQWGDLDVLLIDLPPGTGDVQLTLGQKTELDGALVVSTPQDVALMDARRAIDMFERLEVPVLGLIENMSVFVCPHCGGESHVFGAGGVRAEAGRLGLPFLGELPLALEVREAGDAGTPVAAGEGAQARAYAELAEKLIEKGVA